MRSTLLFYINATKIGYNILHQERDWMIIYKLVNLQISVVYSSNKYGTFDTDKILYIQSGLRNNWWMKKKICNSLHACMLLVYLSIPDGVGLCVNSLLCLKRIGMKWWVNLPITLAGTATSRPIFLLHTLKNEHLIYWKFHTSITGSGQINVT